MAITNGYATLPEFKAWVDITSADAPDDGVIEDIIETASRHIDNTTGRTFYARTETRYYDVPDGRQIDLDDDGVGYACDLDTLQVEETTITIYQGWTLFALPYNPIGVDNSEDLGQAVMDQGASCDVIMTYDGLSQEWIDDIGRLPHKGEQ